MTDTGYAAFDRAIEKTNRLLSEIEDAYGWPRERRRQSYAALRAVLHALRDHLTVEEGAHLAAQLPMLAVGVFYQGWDPGRLPERMDREEFLAVVAREFPFQVEGGPERLVRTVLRALRAQVSEGELRDVRSSMPRDVASLFA